MSLSDHLPECAVYSFEPGVRHQSHDRERKGAEHFPAAHERISALYTYDLADCEKHVCIVVTDDNNIVRIM